MIQLRPRYPNMNSTMTTAPTIQIIWFTVRFHLLLYIVLCTTAWILFRCVSERSSDNPDGIDLDKPFELLVNIRHVPAERGHTTIVR